MQLRDFRIGHVMDPRHDAAACYKTCRRIEPDFTAGSYALPDSLARALKIDEKGGPDCRRQQHADAQLSPGKSSLLQPP